MARTTRKSRLLHLARLLFENTDPGAGLTCRELIERLSIKGQSVDRRTLYDDIRSLKSFGMDIRCRQHSTVEYYLGSRLFDETELLLICDAIQSTRFLTACMAQDLVERMGLLGSIGQRRHLAKKLDVEGRIRMQNESVFYALDCIQEAIDTKQKIEFRYVQFDCSKRLVEREPGRVYAETPVGIITTDGFCYCVAYNDKYQDFVHYRIDRMQALKVSSLPATSNQKISSFDSKTYRKGLFGMYSGPLKGVTLHVRQAAMGGVIDRFGPDVDCIDNLDGTANVYVKVATSPVFYGWVAQFGGQVCIAFPSDVASSYAKFLQGAQDAQLSLGQA